MQELCYLVSSLYRTITGIKVFLNPLPGPFVLWSRLDLFKCYYLFFAFPLLLLDLVAIRIWTCGHWTLSVHYVQPAIAYTHLQAIWNCIKGTN